MNIQPYIDLDQQLLLSVNGSDSLFWDGFMWTATSTATWIPLACVLLYVIFKNKSVKESLLLLVMLALVITFADQIASGICKPYFARFRPAQDPELMYMVDVVNGYRGGRYGFISSHAANTMGVALFLACVFRHKWLSVGLFSWWALNCYTRMYLGVHYPGDIFFGTIDGIVCGLLIYGLHQFLHRKFFKESRFVSNQYTSSGYLKTDVNLILMAMLLTLVFIVVWGMYTTYRLHL